MVRLVDSHCHLQADPFATDATQVLDAARAAGLERVLAPGWDLSTSRASLDLAAAMGVDAGVGIHPHVAAGVTGVDREELAGLAADRRVVAIGETGLDYDRALSPRDVQLDNLRWHVELAYRHAKPLILHCRSARGERDAQDDLIRELREHGLGGTSWRSRFQGRPPAVLHSFSGPVDYAEAALDMGCAVSISGLAFRAGEEPTADVARLVPPDRLLTETDSPWLAPPGAPRRRNEPRWVEVTARWVAQQRGADPDALGDALVDAYDRTFPRSGAAAAG